MALAFEADHVFTNLLCLADHDRQVPVVVKLGHDCIQIASVSYSTRVRDTFQKLTIVAETRSHTNGQIVYHRCDTTAGY